MKRVLFAALFIINKAFCISLQVNSYASLATLQGYISDNDKNVSATFYSNSDDQYGKYHLNSPIEIIDNDYTISLTGYTSVHLVGDDVGRILRIDDCSDVVISNFHIENGHSLGLGGALWITGSNCDLNEVSFSYNNSTYDISTGNSLGGAIFCENAFLNFYGCYFGHNT